MLRAGTICSMRVCRRGGIGDRWPSCLRGGAFLLHTSSYPSFIAPPPAPHAAAVRFACICLQHFFFLFGIGHA